MPVGKRGQRLAGLAVLLALCVPGSGCQTSRMNCPSCNTAASSASGSVKPASGMIAQFQALTMPRSGAKSSPTATLYKTQPTARVPADVSTFVMTDRSGTTPTGSGVQPAGARQTTNEPPALSKIPVTSTSTGNPMAMNKLAPVATTVPMTGSYPGTTYPTYIPGPVAMNTPISYVPGGGTYVAGPAQNAVSHLGSKVEHTVASIKAKVNDYHTADPIKYAMPLPHGVPREFEKRSLPPYIVEPPDILLIESTAELKGVQPIGQQHLVRPDGTVSLGVYGEVYVAGKTIAQAKEAIIQVLSARLKEVKENNTNVDVIAYNSKKYYIITDGGGFGESVYPFPITGNETVLDALANIYGLPTVASKKNIWVARATPDGSPYPKILPVDWKGISQYGSASTNFQILPGDRIYVKADNWISFDTWLARRLAPIDRLFGSTLLSGAAINAARNAGR